MAVVSAIGYALSFLVFGLVAIPVSWALKGVMVSFPAMCFDIARGGKLIL